MSFLFQPRPSQRRCCFPLGQAFLLTPSLVWLLKPHTHTHTHTELYFFTNSFLSLPGGSDGKESTYNAGDPGDPGSIPGCGRPPGEGNGNHFQYSCLGNPMDRVACWATVHRLTKESDTTEGLTFPVLFFPIHSRVSVTSRLLHHLSFFQGHRTFEIFGHLGTPLSYSLINQLIHLAVIWL